MVSFSLIGMALSCLALVNGATISTSTSTVPATSTSIAPNRGDFTWAGKTFGRPNCPEDSGTVYTTSEGDKYGILCGWDTNDTSFFVGPLYGYSFDKCLCKCSRTQGCTVATYTGTCYLKTSAKGKGFINTGLTDNWTAIKLNN